MITKPKIWFFVESIDWFETPQLRARWLIDLFEGSVGCSDKSLAEEIKNHNYGIVLALQSLDEEIAVLVKYLNKIGVSTKFWMLLPDSIGYWTNIFNIQELDKFINSTTLWIKKNDLKIEGLGIDLEWPIQLFQQSPTFVSFIRRLTEYQIRSFGKKGQARKIIDKIIKYSSIPLEFYVFPTPMHFLLGGGIWPKNTWRKISMEYVSFLPKKVRNISVGISRSISFRNSISAIGIVGTEKGKTPGRKLGQKSIDHLKSIEISFALSKLFENNAKEIYIFALENSKTFELVNLILKNI